MLVWLSPAARIFTVSWPLSTIRVLGSQTWLRMPTCALPRPASSSRLVSPGLRGAGPPNKVSIACCWASLADRPEVPATGGVRLKSGGMISGALRATANSSGVLAPVRNAPHPLVVTAAASTRTVKSLRIFMYLLGAAALRLILTAQERAQQQDHDGNANRGIADIEYQKRPPFAKVKVGEIDDIAVQRPVEDVAERAAKHHAERDLVDAVLFAADPEGDADRDRARQPDQHPAADLRRGVQQPERNALVLRVGELEERQQIVLRADKVDLQRTRDDPLHQLVEREDCQRDGEAEGAGFHQFLPGTGRGTTKWWRGPSADAAERWAPTVSPTDCHLPVPGRTCPTSPIQHLVAAPAEAAVFAHVRQMPPAAP